MNLPLNIEFPRLGESICFLILITYSIICPATFIAEAGFWPVIQRPSTTGISHTPCFIDSSLLKSLCNTVKPLHV